MPTICTHNLLFTVLATVIDNGASVHAQSFGSTRVYDDTVKWWIDLIDNYLHHKVYSGHHGGDGLNVSNSLDKIMLIVRKDATFFTIIISNCNANVSEMDDELKKLGDIDTYSLEGITTVLACKP
jgi:hypothetical protein